MSDAAEVLTPTESEDTSFHVSLGECLSGEARLRLLSLHSRDAAEPTPHPAAFPPEAQSDANMT